VIWFIVKLLSFFEYACIQQCLSAVWSTRLSVRFLSVFSIVTFDSLLAIALIWWRLAKRVTLLVLIERDMWVLILVLSLLLTVNFNIILLTIVCLVILINLYLYWISNFNDNAVINLFSNFDNNTVIYFFRLLRGLLFRFRGILWITPLIQYVGRKILRILNKMFCVGYITLLCTLVVAFELLAHHKR